jgi:hypothetical protein
MRLGREHPDHPVGETTVQRYVQVRKRELGLSGREVFVPQSYELGQEAQVDWFEGMAKLGGEVVKLQFFAMRSMGSGDAFHWVYPHATQQALLEAHEQPGLGPVGCLVSIMILQSCQFDCVFWPCASRLPVAASAPAFKKSLKSVTFCFLTSSPGALPISLRRGYRIAPCSIPFPGRTSHGHERYRLQAPIARRLALRQSGCR